MFKSYFRGNQINGIRSLAPFAYQYHILKLCNFSSNFVHLKCYFHPNLFCIHLCGRNSELFITRRFNGTYLLTNCTIILHCNWNSKYNRLFKPELPCTTDREPADQVTSEGISPVFPRPDTMSKQNLIKNIYKSPE